MACDHDSDAMHLARPEEVVCEEIFEKDAVPLSRLALVNMILDGPNTKHQIEQTETTTTSAALSISQLLKFTCKERVNRLSTLLPVHGDPCSLVPVPVNEDSCNNQESRAG